MQSGQMSQNGSLVDDPERVFNNDEHENEVEEENTKVMIQSLHLKVEELTGLIKSATVIASKAVLEEQPTKECSKLTAKVKALKKQKEEVNGLLNDLLENSTEGQYQRDEYETASDRQSFFGGVHTPASARGEQQAFFQKRSIVPKDMPKYGKGEYKDIEDFVLGFEKVLNAYKLEYDVNWERLLPLGLQCLESQWVEANLARKQFTWKEAKTLLVKHYTQPMCLSKRLRSLFMGNVKDMQNIHTFCDEFVQTMRDCNVKNDNMLLMEA
jgi:hypothetical protein